MPNKTQPFPLPVTEVRLQEPPEDGSYISTIEPEVAAMYLCCGLPLVKLMAGYISNMPACVMIFKGKRAYEVREAQWKNLLPEPVNYQKIKAELEALVDAELERRGIKGGEMWKELGARIFTK